jgi:ribosomal protein L17
MFLLRIPFLAGQNTMQCVQSCSDEGMQALQQATYVLTSVPPVAAKLYDPVSPKTAHRAAGYVRVQQPTTRTTYGDAPWLSTQLPS